MSLYSDLVSFGVDADFAAAVLDAECECGGNCCAGAEFKGSKGNPDALRKWYEDGAGGQIKWGEAGDFRRCQEIASKYMDSSLTGGFCQERHIAATGEPSGHAAGEKED